MSKIVCDYEISFAKMKIKLDFVQKQQLRLGYPVDLITRPVTLSGHFLPDNNWPDNDTDRLIKLFLLSIHFDRIMKLAG